MTVLAHLGHWSTTVAFFGPVLLLPLACYGLVLVERRRSTAGDASG